MQLSVVLTWALPVRSVESALLELTCITQLGAVMVMLPLPATFMLCAAVRLSASRQYSLCGEVGASMAVALALTFIVEIPREPRKSIGTEALVLPVKLPSPLSTKLGVLAEMPLAWNSALKVFCAVCVQLAVSSLAPARIAASSAPCICERTLLAREKSVAAPTSPMIGTSETAKIGTADPRHCHQRPQARRRTPRQISYIGTIRSSRAGPDQSPKFLSPV